MLIDTPLLRLDIVLDTELETGDRRDALTSASGILRANMHQLIMRSTYEELLVERQSILEARGFVSPEDHDLSWSYQENNWTPAYESTIDVWYAPDAYFVVDGKVAVAEDKSGKKIDVYNTANADQPDLATSTLNGFKGMSFDGTEVLYHDPADNDPDIGVYDSAVDISEGGLTAAVMINYGPDEDDGANIIVGLNAGTGTAGATDEWNIRSKDNTGTPFYRGDWGNVHADSTDLVVDANQFVVWGTLSAAATRIAVNGGTATGNSLATLNDIDPSKLLNIGGMVNNTSVTNGFEGTIYEVVVFKKHINDDLQQKIEGYFAHKYGLTGSLPSDHPYKSISPKVKG